MKYQPREAHFSIVLCTQQNQYVTSHTTPFQLQIETYHYQNGNNLFHTGTCHLESSYTISK